MANKRHKPEEIVQTLRQIDAGHGACRCDTRSTCYRADLAPKSACAMSGSLLANALASRQLP